MIPAGDLYDLPQKSATNCFQIGENMGKEKVTTPRKALNPEKSESSGQDPNQQK